MTGYFYYGDFPDLGSTQADFDRWMQNTYLDESRFVQDALAAPPLSPAQQEKASEQAIRWMQAMLDNADESIIERLLKKYDLSSAEGLSLLCLSEALLRIPDVDTKNALIRDKLSNTQWTQDESGLMAWAARGLSVSGQLMRASNSNAVWARVWMRMVNRLSAPVVRQALRQVMDALAKQFIQGKDMAAALSSAGESSARFSYDMLGEVARTDEDAERYFQSYFDALQQLSALPNLSDDYWANPSLSVKLSSLHPRYEGAKWETALPVLIDRVRSLCLLAKKHHLAIAVDAEEASTGALNLWLLHALCHDEALKDWSGLSVVVQTYQKRAMACVEWLAALAKSCHKKIPVRLVKGAYWDTEIKHAQVLGLSEYPVFTQRIATDLNYLVVAKRLLADNDCLPAQFATHNAYTAAAVQQLIAAYDKPLQVECQRLHGMGEALYDTIKKDMPSVQVGVYAPVGNYDLLLPYLVRRILENGANGSFVNQWSKAEDLKALATDPVQLEWEYWRHPRIPVPADIFPKRDNSSGIDFDYLPSLVVLENEISAAAKQTFDCQPSQQTRCDWQTIVNPANHQQTIGRVKDADDACVLNAMQVASEAFKSWHQEPLQKRADYLRSFADAMVQARGTLLYLLVHEAGRLLPDAVDEWREAIDFCRYYAMQAEEKLADQNLPGPTGESDVLHLQGRGVVLCISPWNFPLAIFTGQIAAALVTGNTVLAKPAEQTPLIAGFLFQLWQSIDLPKDVLQLLPGEGAAVCQSLWSMPALQGVMFTGSTEAAQNIALALAKRKTGIIPFVAETGGVNAMIADSSALAEQLVDDVLYSAFDSAGQRCSALRLLCVQADVADRVIAMLKGALKTWVVGDPSKLSTDVGPVIDQTALTRLQAYQKANESSCIAMQNLSDECQRGCFCAPAMYEITEISACDTEVFGPILHIYRYQSDQLLDTVDAINALGYGLTFGVHSRIQETVDAVSTRIKAGNVYVNRNMVGAVVGSQPFGGSGLSGTGPKAGGPHYLQRLCHEKVISTDTTAVGGNAHLMSE